MVSPSFANVLDMADSSKLLESSLEKFKGYLETLLRDESTGVPKEDLEILCHKITALLADFASVADPQIRLDLLTKFDANFQEFIARHKDFIPAIISQRLQVYKAAIQFCNFHYLIIVSRSKTNGAEKFRLIYEGARKLLDFVEKSIKHLPVEWRDKIQLEAESLLTESTASKSKPENQPFLNYIQEAENAWRSILWELHKFKQTESTPANFSTSESILQYALNAPGWAGDDFEDCLNFVNDTRG